MEKDVFSISLEEHLKTFQSLETLRGDALKLSDIIVECFRRGNKILLMGNGGSAADCQHMAAELVGRYKMERRGLPAIALTTDTSILTALGNDYDYNRIFARQIEALGIEGDLVLGISTSGNSENIIEGLHKAREMGCQRAALLGNGGGKIRGMTDFSLVINSGDTPRIQESHLFLIHVLCEIVESSLANV